MAPGPSIGVLGLDEIADMGPLADDRARPQPRERADDRASASIVAPSKWQKPLISTPSATSTPGPKTTLGPTTTSRPSLVSAEKNTVCGSISVAPFSIACARRRVLQDGLGGGQLGAAVDADQLVGRRLHDRAGGAVGARDGDDVGQVVLALGIGVADAIEQGEQALAVDRHDAGIAERDGALLGVGVAVLDDRLEQAVGADDEPAIAARDRRAACPARPRPDRLGARRRSIMLARVVALEMNGRVAIDASGRRRRSPAARRAPPTTAWPVPSCSAWSAVAWGATACGDRLHARRRSPRRSARRPSGARLASTWPIMRRGRRAVQHLRQLGSSCACPCRRQGRRRRCGFQPSANSRLDRPDGGRITPQPAIAPAAVQENRSAWRNYGAAG